MKLARTYREFPSMDNRNVPGKVSDAPHRRTFLIASETMNLTGLLRVARCGVLMCGVALLCTVPAAAQYSAHQEGDVVRLEDAKTQTLVSVMPSHGNSAFDMR